MPAAPQMAMASMSPERRRQEAAEETGAGVAAEQEMLSGRKLFAEDAFKREKKVKIAVCFPLERQ